MKNPLSRSKGIYQDWAMKRDMVIGIVLYLIMLIICLTRLITKLYFYQHVINIWIPIIFAIPFLIFTIVIPILIRFQPNGRKCWHDHWKTTWVRAWHIGLIKDITWVSLFWPAAVLVNIYDFIIKGGK